MELNWHHVVIWNITVGAIILLGFIYKQDLLISIGCVLEFAQSLPLSLWAIGKMFPDEEQNTSEVKS